MIAREEAWTLLNEHTKNPNLIKHALAVEAALVLHGMTQRQLAKRTGFAVEILTGY